MSMTDFLKSLFAPAPAKIGVGQFFSGVDRGDARFGVMGDTPEQELSQLRHSVADQTAEIRAIATHISDTETRARLEQEATELEALAVRTAQMIELKKAEGSSGSGNASDTAREGEGPGEERHLPILTTENRCTADVMLARAARARDEAMPAEEVATPTVPRLAAAVAEPAAELARPASSGPKFEALSSLLSDISVDWAKQDHAPQGQDVCRTQQMRLAAPGFALPDMAAIARRKPQGFALAA
jgi:hypothetical protein